MRAEPKAFEGVLVPGLEKAPTPNEFIEILYTYILRNR